MVSLFRSLSLPCNRLCEIHSSNPSALDDLSLTKYLKVYLDGYEDLEPEYLELDYFGHKHPLILRGYKEDEDGVDCSVCEKAIISGDEFYRCSVECYFHVHKACVDLPRKIRNTLHLEHLLELICRSEYNFDSCNLCEMRLKDRFSYHCGHCYFALHLNCAKATNFKEPHGHAEHSFTNLKPTLFTCDACGVSKETKVLSRVCTGCQLQVHTRCSRNSYPFTVKSRVHDHEISLVYMFQIDLAYAESFCKICFRKMNSVLLMFQCAGCGYLAHAKCVMSLLETTSSADKRHWFDNAGQIYIPDELIDDALAVKDGEVMQVSFLEPMNQIEQRQVIKHFSHPHDLIYGDDEARLDAFAAKDGFPRVDFLEAICDGCVRPISDPYYTCANEGCNFFIHKQCSELPNSIQHPLHPAHLLTLTHDLDLLRCGLLVQCYACQYFFNGFAYWCRECNFSLDVGCSLLAYTLSHDSHNCTLTLIDTRCWTYSEILEKTKCGACDSSLWCKYVCAECVFVVDVRCVSLPKTLRHECPKYNWKVMNTSKLLYGAIKDSSGIYFCDVCEESRGENDWYYYCEDCPYNQHPECALGGHLIKYGKVYEIIDHPHPLTLTMVKKTQKTHYCENCGHYCKCLAVFFCGVCNVYFHLSAKCCSESYITTVVFKQRQAIQHFSHPHDLISGEEEAKLDTICDGCVRPISNPYYTCANEGCNFFIHKQCSELPNSIQHPLHPKHPLTLTDGLDLLHGTLLNQCYACHYLFNGLAYICWECNFFLDVGCGLLTYTLNHDSHKCTLTLIDESSRIYSEILEKTKCAACDDGPWCKYVCSECIFVLDARCVSLPKRLRHECPTYNWKVMYTSKLLYGAIKNRSGIYFCDVCEESRGEKHWYYYCDDCHYNQHPKCALGDNLIKYGKVYEIKDHPHPLTLTMVKKTQKTHYCENCGDDCECLAVLFCGVCNVYFHPSAKCCSESYITTVVFDGGNAATSTPRKLIPLQND